MWLKRLKEVDLYFNCNKKFYVYQNFKGEYLHDIDKIKECIKNNTLNRFYSINDLIRYFKPLIKFNSISIDYYGFDSRINKVIYLVCFDRKGFIYGFFD